MNQQPISGQNHFITYGRCLDVWKNSRLNETTAIAAFIKDNLNLSNIPDWIDDSISETARFVHLKIKQNSIMDYIEEAEARTSGELTSRTGRPMKPFVECSEKTKRRKIKELVENKSIEELSFAVEIAKGVKIPQKKGFSIIETLALSLELKLSMRQYKNLPAKINLLHPETFPTYHAIKNFKNSLLPNNCTVNENGAEVDMQEILDKTASSIVKLIPNINLKTGNALSKMRFRWKFGAQ
ncbi:hypothetical protein ANTQUA_LOCUS5953 [Anthophora quadrimaculata]